MQNAKDTFYEELRGRVAALNPERTVEVRGALRPGVVVEENELPIEETLTDCFRLQWAEAAVDGDGELPLVALRCEIAYETAGTAVMDRGRALAAMDGELLRVLRAAPLSVLKMDYRGLPNGGAAKAMATKIWWGEALFGKTAVRGERVGRVATVEVMSFEEAGDQ